MELWNPGVELMSPDDIRALQLEKLKRQLVRVYEESPYYKSKFDKAKLDPAKLGSLEEIRYYPFCPHDSSAARRFSVRPHRSGRAAEGARQTASGHRYRPIRAGSPICEAPATSDGSLAQISLRARCT